MTSASQTPLRSIRVSDTLWKRARARAIARGDSLSDVVRSALADYVLADDEQRQVARYRLALLEARQPEEALGAVDSGRRDG
jgi:hypothetical protein